MNKKLVLTALLAVAVSGCAGTRTGEAIGVAVAGYCGASPEARALARVTIDQSTAPHQVRIQCANDEK